MKNTINTLFKVICVLALLIVVVYFVKSNWWNGVESDSTTESVVESKKDSVQTKRTPKVTVLSGGNTNPRLDSIRQVKADSMLDVKGMQLLQSVRLSSKSTKDLKIAIDAFVVELDETGMDLSVGLPYKRMISFYKGDITKKDYVDALVAGYVDSVSAKEFVEKVEVLKTKNSSVEESSKSSDVNDSKFVLPILNFLMLIVMFFYNNLYADILLVLLIAISFWFLRKYRSNMWFAINNRYRSIYQKLSKKEFKHMSVWDWIVSVPSMLLILYIFMKLLFWLF